MTTKQLILLSLAATLLAIFVMPTAGTGNQEPPTRPHQPASYYGGKLKICAYRCKNYYGYDAYVACVIRCLWHDGGFNTIKKVRGGDGSRSGSHSGSGSKSGSGSHSGSRSGSHSGSRSGSHSGSRSGSHSGSRSGSHSGSNSGRRSGGKGRHYYY